MQTMLNDVQTYDNGNGKRRMKGRKDADKQEKIIQLDAIKASLPELLELHTAVVDSNAAFSDAIKVTAEKGGVQASVLRKFVKATAGDQREEKKRENEQLCLLFDEVSE